MSNQHISDRRPHLAAVGLAVCRINHGLRNILASAQLISDQLSQVEDPTVQHLVPQLIASLDRAIALCSSTIKYGQAHEAPPRRRRMALAPLVEEVADSLGLIDHKEIDWANAVAPNIEIDADPDHLFRALLNLCRNAMAALDKTGRRRKEIRICARRDGAVCTIEVRDTGPGVPEKARAHLVFLHVPFPPAGVFAELPCRDDLIQAMSAFDLLGFQTSCDVENFREVVLQRLGGTATDDGLVLACGRRIRLGAFPVGIDTERFAALAASPEVGKLCDRLQGCFEGDLGAVGADRLDCTKGITQRLHAFERLLATATDFSRRAFLLQIAAPAREAVPEYSDLRIELEALSGRINARYADVDWTPVRFLNRTFSHMRLAALFRLSRVGLVTPLRDGMNLVAKEYLAAQDAEDPGVLVLSRFAGPAEQLDAALIVDPYDIDGVAEALRDAFAMPLVERRERWSNMMAGLREHDVHDWRARFLDGLKTAKRSIIRSSPRVAVKSVGASDGMGSSGHHRPPAFPLDPEDTVPRVNGI